MKKIIKSVLIFIVLTCLSPFSYAYWSYTKKESMSHFLRKDIDDKANISFPKENSVIRRSLTVSAGSDKALIFPENRTIFKGEPSEYSGITTITWRKISGPYATFSNPDNLHTAINDLEAGNYIFEISITNNLGETASDQVNVSVQYPSAPSNLYNYIKETTVLVPQIKSIKELPNLSVNQKSLNIAYFDGLGRPMQSISWQASPNKKDLIQPVVYDQYGREVKKYLPYVSSESNGLYKQNPVGTDDNTYSTSPQYQFYQTASQIAHDLQPYAKTIFESSPLGRTIEQGAAGVSWQPGTIQSATVKVNYQFNAANEVKLLEYYGSSVRYPKDYNVNTLFKTITKDEHQNEVIEFKNAEGQVVLKRLQNGGKNMDTYYIYDIHNNLRVVVPPQASDELPTSASGTYTLSSGFLDKWCFQYYYDLRKRMIEKKLPGAGSIRIVYDKRNRVVLTQDAAQALQNDWIYTKYDALDRPIITGKHKDNRALTTIQGEINAQAKWYESASIDWHGYTQNNCYPFDASNEDVLTVNYYDNYDFPGKSYWELTTLNYDFIANELIPQSTKQSIMKGFATASKTKVLNTTKWLNTVMYYDNNNRVIQTVSKNYSGGTDRTSNQYDFSGKVLATKHIHTGVKDAAITQSFVYDHAGRLLKTYHLSGDDATKMVLLAENKYNELGQLIDKGLGVKNNIPLQSMDYRYNIRGWLTSINNSALSNDGSLNDDSNDVFGMELLYEKPLGISGLSINYLPKFELPSINIDTIGINSYGSNTNSKYAFRSTLNKGLFSYKNQSVNN